jgi:hypothetical protein
MPKPPQHAHEADLDTSDEAVSAIVRQGPRGTWAVAGLATLIVVLIYFLFYFLAYLPRGAVH